VITSEGYSTPESSRLRHAKGVHRSGAASVPAAKVDFQRCCKVRCMHARRSLQFLRFRLASV
jgi:hypothetical protein